MPNCGRTLPAHRAQAAPTSALTRTQAATARASRACCAAFSARLPQPSLPRCSAACACRFPPTRSGLPPSPPEPATRLHSPSACCSARCSSAMCRRLRALRCCFFCASSSRWCSTPAAPLPCVRACFRTKRAPRSFARGIRCASAPPPSPRSRRAWCACLPAALPSATSSASALRC